MLARRNLVYVVVVMSALMQFHYWRTLPIQIPNLDDIVARTETTETKEVPGVNMGLSQILSRDAKLGWEKPYNGSTAWMEELCPEVVDHFTRFPYYSEIPSIGHQSLPLHTTAFAVQSVCTMKMVQLLAHSIDAQVYIHAGSHLGAALHGGPIPWDDDVDMWMNYEKQDAFMDICNQDYVYRFFRNGRPVGHDVQLHCINWQNAVFPGFKTNAIKVWLQPPGMKKLTSRKKRHFSPYVDLFLFKISSNNTGAAKIYEVDPSGRKNLQEYLIEDYFPTRPWYFGGLHFLGPPMKISERRYNLDICVMADHNHRLEKPAPAGNKKVDCDLLRQYLPFFNSNGDTLLAGERSILKLPFPQRFKERKPNVNIQWSERKKLAQASLAEGKMLTDQIPNLNDVHIDNSISNRDGCRGDELRVAEYTAEEGKRWLEAAELLKDADVIILNGMDFGMARSGQQDTTRLLAQFLGMNYAWGLESIELNPATPNEDGVMESNFYGLHGNAILSKCEIKDPKVFRDPVGDYVSNKEIPSDSNGPEKRLGGRMILLARIIVDQVAIAIGSVHKLDEHREAIEEYIGDSAAVIAGYQKATFCNDVGLQTIAAHENDYTWKASCESVGRERADNICSNMKLVDQHVEKPCLAKSGVSVGIGDHSLLSTKFKIIKNVSG